MVKATIVSFMHTQRLQPLNLAYLLINLGRANNPLEESVPYYVASCKLASHRFIFCRGPLQIYSVHSLFSPPRHHLDDKAQDYTNFCRTVTFNLRLRGNSGRRAVCMSSADQRDSRLALCHLEHLKGLHFIPHYVTCDEQKRLLESVLQSKGRWTQASSCVGHAML